MNYIKDRINDKHERFFRNGIIYDIDDSILLARLIHSMCGYKFDLRKTKDGHYFDCDESSGFACKLNFHPLSTERVKEILYNKEFYSSFYTTYEQEFDNKEKTILTTLTTDEKLNKLKECLKNALELFE